MTSVVAILTYKRHRLVRAFLDSILNCSPGTAVAVFEDCGNDGTVEDLTDGAEFVANDYELDSRHWRHPRGYEVFAANHNLGVTGQSNKALRWFERSGADHLCLCNDDLLATGDFAREYAYAHTATGNHLWTFCDFEKDGYRGLTTPFRGIEIRLQPRMTGMMMSITKPLFMAIGYFDQFWESAFSQEHCDFNNRAFFSGMVHLNGQAIRSLDIVSRHLKSVDTNSTITPVQKPALDKLGETAINRAAHDYDWFDLFRPFGLVWPRVVGGQGSGVEAAQLQRCGYQLVRDWAPANVS